MPPGHPCLFYFSFFFVFPFPFGVPGVLLFVLYFFVCSLNHLIRLFSLLCSSWWRIASFCLGSTPPLRCLRACKSAYSLCVLSFFLEFLILILFLFFFSSFPLFRFRFGRRLFHPVLFLWVLYLCCLLGFGFCSVCVLHIKPVFLPVDIQNIQCPCRFVILERDKQALWPQNHDTEIPHCNAVTML